MSFYAHFDPKIPDPKPVIGWYDTSAMRYPNLPPPEEMLELSPEDWAQRMSGQWAVVGGRLTQYVPALPKMSTTQQVLAAESAGVTVRCVAHPEVDGIYAIDSATLSRLSLIGFSVDKLESTSSFSWPDKSGAHHLFPDSATFLAFVHTVARYIAAIQAAVAANSPLPLPEVDI